MRRLILGLLLLPLLNLGCSSIEKPSWMENGDFFTDSAKQFFDPAKSNDPK